MEIITYKFTTSISERWSESESEDENNLDFESDQVNQKNSTCDHCLKENSEKDIIPLKKRKNIEEIADIPAGMEGKS
jgi:hypothetical protein